MIEKTAKVRHICGHETKAEWPIIVDPLPYFLTTLTAVCFEFHYHFENISFWSKIEKILNHWKYFDYNELLFTLISTGAPYYVKLFLLNLIYALVSFCWHLGIFWHSNILYIVRYINNMYILFMSLIWLIGLVYQKIM